MTTRIRKQLMLASCGSLFTFAMATVVLPISLVEVRKELVLSLTQAGTLSFTISIVELILLLVAIPVAAILGKIKLLRWGLWIISLGMILFVSIQGFPGAVMAVFVIAIGQGFQEALVAPLVADIYPNDDGSRQSWVHIFWPAGIMIGTLIFGEALTLSIHWRILFLSVAALAIIAGSVYPRRLKASLPPVRADFTHAGEILRNPHFWCMGMAIFLAGSTEGGLTFWMASYIREEYGTLPRAGGFGTAVFAGGMVVGRILLSRVAGRIKLKNIILATSLGLSIAGCGVYLSSSLTMLFIFMFLAGLASSPSWPGLKTYSLRKLGADPTMLMVFLSCMGILGYNWVSFFMGIIGDAAGLRASFLLIPASSVLMFVAVLIESRITVAQAK